MWALLPPSGIHTYYTKEQETQGSGGKEKGTHLTLQIGKEKPSEAGPLLPTPAPLVTAEGQNEVLTAGFWVGRKFFLISRFHLCIPCWLPVAPRSKGDIQGPGLSLHPQVGLGSGGGDG